MPKKLKLDSNFDNDYTLLGIASHHRDYRLIWALNEKMQLRMSKMDNLKVFNDKKNELQEFSLYYFDEPQTFKSYYFITNLGEQGFLFPEYKQMNFFLLIKGNVTEAIKNEMVKDIYSLGIVLTVHTITLSTIKSINNFFSDLELHMLDIGKKTKEKK
ncbi:MAG TPA: IPExxxVDY family protein [Bacteroidales bacterium]|nr:IPExxxVDY family protein [Bacteroidales bacterium]HPS15784.1 IPExxxVDY family protein [Bacteroidales bacterium]